MITLICALLRFLNVHFNGDIIEQLCSKVVLITSAVGVAYFELLSICVTLIPRYYC